MTWPVDNDERYLVARVGEALAEDPRTSELGIDVTVAGGRVFLDGTVTTPERREAVATVASEAVPGYEICNEVGVAELSEPESREELS